MASVSSAHLIFFIASLVVATAVAGTMVVEVGQVGSAIETRSSGVTDDIETEIAIISDANEGDAIVNESGSNSYDTDLTLLVKNIGDRSLEAEPSEIDVFVDGSYISHDRFFVERADNSDGSWDPSTVVEVTIPVNDIGDGDISVTIMTRGDEDTIRFYYEESD
ncbi:flagellin [Natrarchaeobaculum sulfurireducens]|uniref:Archaellum protein G n=1 Tax=Natrarchaeobaculum sulfurireducens TaxID=2044521 RepID=A0A346PGW7_9EURY|nr:flagellin [Natrarchaeobaculum sulfurireducens]AXR78762.1 Archaellum protein G [Natrarchaeobaculum sulfurireducens]